ncbi:MAG: hypothetical protein REI09_05310 [Candidatus Dactylopiibacterium sp.]|nr:hypothetical protein [Candidatus Dactylopiibacterium sp.]
MTFLRLLDAQGQCSRAAVRMPVNSAPLTAALVALQAVADGHDVRAVCARNWCADLLDGAGEGVGALASIRQADGVLLVEPSAAFCARLAELGVPGYAAPSVEALPDAC